MKLFTSPTVLSTSISYNTLANANNCSAVLSAQVPCANAVGWELWKIRHNNTFYDINTTTWGSTIQIPLAGMSSINNFYYRLKYVDGINTINGISYTIQNAESLRAIITSVTYSDIMLSDCKRNITLSAIANSPTQFQWYYPSNSAIFGANAGAAVPANLGGESANLTFQTGAWTQYNKKPWSVRSYNYCYFDFANVTAKNWCEICSTVPSNLCSNSAREETETTEIAPNLSSKTIIYPNPTERILNIESPENIQKIVLFDIQGKEIAEYLPNEKKYVLDLQNINEGLYFVRIQTVLNTVETFKVQVNR